jgi:hypothetical protein
VGVYIEHYLWGEPEFQFNINPITVEFHSPSSTTTTPPPLLHPSTTFTRALTTSNVAGDPVTSPSPLLRDVGSVNIAPAPSQARMLLQPPLPFPKGCGQLGLAQWWNQEGKKWEAAKEEEMRTQRRRKHEAMEGNEEGMDGGACQRRGCYLILDSHDFIYKYTVSSNCLFTRIWSI